MAPRIFVTVGTQLPFDRLVGAVDAWAATRPHADVFAQIGSGTPPCRIASAATVDPVRFADCMRRADVVVAHAGMGTILTALDLGKPVVVMPRRAALGEHRNEHQRATVERLAHLDALHVAEDEHTLAQRLDALLAVDAGQSAALAPSPARLELVRSVSAFVLGEALPC
ncbi:MAG: glycosyltransferase [Pseudomonadales bacterium]|jgi:UDP-N-acetylglucosamine transferase subunit ALG13|nr:glycosyltransferase [Pseudomonadales bacterium]